LKKETWDAVYKKKMKYCGRGGMGMRQCVGGGGGERKKSKHNVQKFAMPTNKS